MLTRNMLRTPRGKSVFLEKIKIRFLTALGLSKALNRSKKQKMLLMCAPFSEQPSNINFYLKFSVLKFFRIRGPPPPPYPPLTPARRPHKTVHHKTEIACRHKFRGKDLAHIVVILVLVYLWLLSILWHYGDPTAQSSPLLLDHIGPCRYTIVAATNP